MDPGKDKKTKKNLYFGFILHPVMVESEGLVWDPLLKT